MAKEILNCILCGDPYFMKGKIGDRWFVGHHAGKGCHADGQWGFGSEEEAIWAIEKVNTPDWLVDLARHYIDISRLLATLDSLGVLKIGEIDEEHRWKLISDMRKKFEALPVHIKREAEKRSCVT